MPVGGKPVNLTNDEALDTDPAWSPDGTQLVYSSDKNAEHLQLWIRDMKSGAEPPGDAPCRRSRRARRGRRTARASRSSTSTACGGSRRCRCSTSRSGTVTKMHDSLPQPGTPTWSPDGAPARARRRRADVDAIPRGHQPGADHCRASERRHRHVVRARADAVDRFARRLRSGVVAGRHEDGRDLSRACSTVWPVAASGEPLGPPRRVTTESAHSPSWAGDSRRLLYQIARSACASSTSKPATPRPCRSI